jgi:hypothetical protein
MRSSTAHSWSTCLAEGLDLCVQSADRLGITRCLEGLAGVAATTRDETEGSAVRVARLLGSAAAARESLGVPTTLVERATVARATETARAALGDDAFAASWAEGRAMTLEQAVAYSLEESPSA